MYYFLQLYFFHVPPPAPVTIATTAAPTKATQKLQQSPLAAALGASRVSSQGADAPVVKGPGTVAPGVKSLETSASSKKIPKSAADVVSSNKLADVNPGVESNINIERKPTQVSDIPVDQTNVGGTGNIGGGVAGAGGQMPDRQQPASNIEEENKIRTKLAAGERRTNLKSRDKSLNLGERKSRSSSDTRKRRKIIKKRSLA